MTLLKIHRLLKPVNYYISYLAQQSNITFSYKPQAFVALPLQSSIIFIPHVITMQKAFSDFKARLSFSYLCLLIGGSIKFRLILLIAFILLIKGDVNVETANYCVLALALGYYVYMLRNVKFNLKSWLYVLTLLFLAVSLIITFWFLLSLFIPYIIIFCNIDFPHAYDLSINPTDPDNYGGNYPAGPGQLGGDAGGSGGAGGSGQPGGSDPNSQNTLIEKGKSPLEDKDEKELGKVEGRIAEIKATLDSLKEDCWEKQDFAQWAAGEYSQARKDYHEVSHDTIMVEDPVQEGYVPSGHLEHVTSYHTNQYQEAEYKLREAGIQLNNAQEELEQAENALRKTSNLRIELGEAENKILSLVDKSKKK